MEWLLAILVSLAFVWAVGAAFMTFVGLMLLVFPSMNAPTDIPPRNLLEVLRVGMLWFYYMFRKEPGRV